MLQEPNQSYLRPKQFESQNTWYITEKCPKKLILDTAISKPTHY